MRLTLCLAGAFGATALALKAYARHSGGDGDNTALLVAADMQIMHALLLFAIGWLREYFGQLLAYVSAAVLLGVALFCFPIYGHHLLGLPKWVEYITPIGGVLLIASWSFLAAIPWLPRRDDE